LAARGGADGRHLQTGCPVKPIRVAYIDHTALLSGGEIALLNLVTHLDRTKVDPVVVLFSAGPLLDALRVAGVETYLLPLGRHVLDTRKDSLGLSSIAKLRHVLASGLHSLRLARLLRKIAPSIVHTNSLKSDIIGGLAGRLAWKTVIWHVRDRIADDYLPRKVVRLFRLLARWIPHHVIANSQATLETLQHSNRQQSVVYSGVVIHDGTLIPDARQASSSSVPTVGMIGRISPWKGQDVLIDAAAMLRDRGVVCRFRIVGSAMFAEDEYDQKIRAKVNDLGLADRFQFTGFRRDVQGEIAMMSLLVHASKTPEPFGQVVVEGMAAGKPVIATRAGGVVEIVEDGVSGILVEPGDPVSLAGAIERVLADPVLAGRLGRQGRERAVARFSIDRVARDVEALYERLTRA
jgi:glycosyltransferase involved in cell wall biosynthesis